MSSTKRVVAMGDLHSGALFGLTPPSWQTQMKEPPAEKDPSKQTPPEKDRTKRNKFSKLQSVLWGHYDSMLKALAPIDCLLVNGDCIDGRGERTGGTELITTDQQKQVDMAGEAINHVRLYAARGFKIVMTYGTNYHSGHGGEDWENDVADKVDAKKIGSHEWPEVNGCVFDLKHHVGSSSIPHGRGTALRRSMLWNQIWAEVGLQPRANIVLRSHVHYYSVSGDSMGLGFTLPALCGFGSKYGARICEGIVDFGMMHFDIDTHGNVVNWDKHIVVVEEQRAQTIKL